jgi:hypothetical protein
MQTLDLVQRPRDVSPFRPETNSFTYEIFIIRFKIADANEFLILLRIFA